MTEIVTSKIDRIKGLITGALDQIINAGKLLCELLDADETLFDELIEKKVFNKAFIRSLEAVGRQQLRPELFFAETPGHKALRKLPYQEQSKWLERSIEVLTQDGQNTLKVTIDNLTIDQAKQVFGEGGVRDKAAQRAFIEGAKMNKLTNVTPAIPYQIKKHTLVVTGPCSFTSKELLRLIGDMT